MIDTKKKVVRKGAGRTCGSFSFATMTPAEMLKLNPNPDFKWLVSRKQAEMLGGSSLQTGRVGDLKESLAGTSEETKAKVVATEL